MSWGRILEKGESEIIHLVCLNNHGEKEKLRGKNDQRKVSIPIFTEEVGLLTLFQGEKRSFHQREVKISLESSWHA
jgi:hypothetical protein